LRWRSADPAARPEIRSRLLVDPHDRALMLASMRLAMELAHTPELRALATPLWPKADVVRDPVRGDAWIRGATDSGYHPCGTAPMGADDDPDAVCDGRGRVRRVDPVEQHPPRGADDRRADRGVAAGRLIGPDGSVPDAASARSG
jgi:choline dehydrogenase